MALTKVGKEGITGISNSSDATAITIDSSENVGIGKSSSITDKLHIENTGGNCLLSVARTDGAAGRLVMQHTSGEGSLQTTSAVPLTFGTSDTERIRIDTSGRLLMGVTSPTNGGESFYIDAFDGFRLFCSRGSTALREQIVFHNPNGDVGSIDTDGSSTSYNTSSDYRLKENVADMTGAITRVKALAPKRFNFIADADRTVDGFLAHEAQTVVPEAVTGTKDEVDADGNAVIQGIDQSKLVPLLTAALKESIAKIEALEARVKTLEDA
jgi:hypothetical protein